MHSNLILRFAAVTGWVVIAIVCAVPFRTFAMTIEQGGFLSVKDYVTKGKALPVPFGMVSFFFAQTAEAETLSMDDLMILQKAAEAKDLERKAAALDKYFSERNMPLEGYGAKLVQEAENNGLDWRLLPAIALRETSGGKHACRKNPFGWGSCKIGFTSFDKAIEAVAWNLGGNNPATADYYDGELRDVLRQYNGGVVRRYPEQVMRIMEKLES